MVLDKFAAYQEFVLSGLAQPKNVRLSDGSDLNQRADLKLLGVPTPRGVSHLGSIRSHTPIHFLAQFRRDLLEEQR